MSSSVLILLSAFFGACETALIRSIGTTHDFLELMTAQYLGVSALCTFWMLKTRTSSHARLHGALRFRFGNHPRSGDSGLRG